MPNISEIAAFTRTEKAYMRKERRGLAENAKIHCFAIFVNPL